MTEQLKLESVASVLKMLERIAAVVEDFVSESMSKSQLS